MTVQGFPIRTGFESAAPGPGRREELAVAWASLQRMRQMLPLGSPNLPAEWERRQSVRAVSLALETIGAAFCLVDDNDVVVATGVQLSLQGGGVVRVDWRAKRGDRSPDGGESLLKRYVVLLTPTGWEALLYRDRGRRFLLVEPGRE